MRELDATVWRLSHGEVVDEPADGRLCVIRLLGGRILGRRVAEVAEIEPLRAGEQLPRGDRLLHVEEEVVPSLQQEGRHGNGVQMRP